MARITIIPPDNTVYVDGVARLVDCSSLPAGINAIQWIGNSGWVEYVNDGLGEFRPNTKFNDLTPYQGVVDLWHAPDKG
jgi:hypothetical protein